MNDENKLIIYQVFTRLFGNNNNHCINNGSITENGCGKMADFTAKALGEIKKLGADLLIEPYNLEGYSNTELEKAEEIFMQGYNTTNDILERLLIDKGSIWKE